MQRIKRHDALEFEFAAREPMLTVDPGESFVIETEDASAGTIRSGVSKEEILSHPNRQASPPKGNPLGGPVHVRGAEPGDLLEIEIERIEVEGHGFHCWIGGSTPLSSDPRWPEFGEFTFHIPEFRPGPSDTTRDGKAYRDGVYEWDLQPMIGCFGVAPEREILTSSIGQSIAGGNLDIRDVKEGTKIRLNVYHPGGLLFLGDVHASQGDTEYCGVAYEAPSEVQARCRVIKNKRIPFIQLDLPDSIVAVRAGKSLDLMVHEAVADLIDWMATDYGVDPSTSYMYVSANPDFRINVYQYTVGLAAIGAEIPKKYLDRSD